MSDALLDVQDLTVSFDAGRVRAVESVGLSVGRAQVVALVGESGSGKSVTALAILRLLPPAARIERGLVAFEGEDLLALSPRRMRGVRGGRIAMIFQEPMTALNPVLTIGEQIVEAVRLHRRVRRRAALDAAVAALEEVGITPAAARLRSYPHQLSGGMRQRVMIAMALACNPRLLLADEPTTALDTTTQARVLDLLLELRRSRGLAVLLITHDLAVAAARADVACVMHRGRVVEAGPAAQVFAAPQHPYTQALIECAPRLDQRRQRLVTVGDVMEKGSGVFSPPRD